MHILPRHIARAGLGGLAALKIAIGYNKDHFWLHLKRDRKRPLDTIFAERQLRGLPT